MKRLSISLLVAIFILGLASVGFGAISGAEKSLEGTVKDIGANMIVVEQATAAVTAESEMGALTEAAPESQTALEVAIEINQDTQFEQISSLDELKEGDQVKVEYTEQENKKIATLVAKIEATEDSQETETRI